MLAEQPVLVRFDGLQKSFGGQTVLDGISGEIRQGEVILLRGENGSGKTTLLNILTGCLEPDRGIIEFSPHGAAKEESFRFPRHWYQELNPFQHFTPERVARLGVGRTWQDIRLFPSLDLADNIAAASTDTDESPWAALLRPSHNREVSHQNRLTASNNLAALGLKGRDESSADKISLGQSKRVAIARALHAEARILLLDEPLAGLDNDGVRDVISHLRTLAAERDLTLIIIEHVLNIPRLLDLVTAVWTLNHGELLVSPITAYRSQIEGAPVVSNLCTLVREVIGEDVPVTTRLLFDGAILTTFWLSGSEPSKSECPVLDIQKVNLVRGGRGLFPCDGEDAAGLCFTLHRNTLSLLEAPNGWGKSSLAGALIGNANWFSGSISYKGGPLPSASWSRVRAGIVVSPSSNELFRSLSVEETLQLGDRLQHAQPVPNHQNSHQRTDSLSGGERQQLALDAFCSMPGSLYIFDEPLAQLDGTHTRFYIDRLVSLALEHAVLILNPGSVPSDCV